MHIARAAFWAKNKEEALSSRPKSRDKEKSSQMHGRVIVRKRSMNDFRREDRVIPPSIPFAFPRPRCSSHSASTTTSQTAIGAPVRSESATHGRIFDNWRPVCRRSQCHISPRFVVGRRIRFSPGGPSEGARGQSDGESTWQTLPTSEEVASLSLNASGESTSVVTVIGVRGIWVSPRNLTIPFFRPMEG